MHFKQKKTKQKWWLPLIIVFFAAVAFSQSDILISRTNNLLLPLRLKVYKTTSNIHDFFNTFFYIKEISKKNEILELTIEKQKHLSSENKSLLKENQHLRELLQMKKKVKYKIIAAQISYIDSLNPYETISIDKGTNDHIKQNMAVISTFGVIGRIKEVFDNHSTVELITSNQSYTSATDENGNTLSILSGQGNEILSLEYIVTDSNIQVGDKIFTSGISDIYKKNLFLGEITSIDNNDVMFKQITVKLPYNIFNLKDVMIIKKER